MDRSTVTRTIKAYRDTVAEACVDQPGLSARLLAGEDRALSDLLDCACATAGVSRAAYEEALCEDPSLRHLAAHSLDEVLLEPNDPGPYAAISRESPSGNTANTHTHPWNGINPPGGVGGSGRAR